jgi:hypothetical protein
MSTEERVRGGGEGGSEQVGLSMEGTRLKRERGTEGINRAGVGT